MLIFVTLSVFVIISSLMPPNTILVNKYISKSILLLLILLIIVYIPSWNLYFSDMLRYVEVFENMKYLSLSQVFQIYEWEPLFLLYQWLLAQIFEYKEMFVIGMFSLYVFILIKAINKIFLPWQHIFVIFLYLCYPFFYGYIFNGIRQGLATVLLLLALGYWIEKRHSIKFYVSIVLASLFHYSSLLFSIAMILVLTFKIRLRTIVSIWVFCLIIYMFDINSMLLNFNFISNIGYIDTYTDSQIYNNSGGANRFAYILFSTVALLTSLCFLKYLLIEEKHKIMYEYIIKSYLALNCIFLLFGFIAYENRLASYSWYLVPILLIYPVLYKQNYSRLLLFLLLFLFLIVGLYNSPFIVYK